MNQKTFNTLARSLFILSIFLGTIVFAGLAHATGVDSQTFGLNPTIVNTTGTGHGTTYVWPSAYSTNGNYARNVYWNFNVDPFVTLPCSSNCNPDATYYGSKDAALKSSDTFSDTGSVGYSGSGATGKIGYIASGNNQSGTAVYSFNASTLKDVNNSDMLYIWAEINVTTTGSSSNNVSFSGLTKQTGDAITIESSEIFSGSGGSPLAQSNSGLFSFNMTGTAATYDAYFAVKDTASTITDLGQDALTLTFSTGNGSGQGSAFVNSLHVAMTPEPISVALFATGIAVLFLRRRKMGLQLA